MIAGRYLDSLDTVRDHSIPGFPAICTGQMMIHLLCDLHLKVSQTQAFDSKFLLEHAGDASFERLVLRGHIQVALFNTETLLQAFRNALNRGTQDNATEDSLFKFSAWGFFDEGSHLDRVNARKLALKDIGWAENNNGRLPKGIDEAFRGQWDRLWVLHRTQIEARRKWARRVSAGRNTGSYARGRRARFDLADLMAAAKAVIHDGYPEHTEAIDKLTEEATSSSGALSGDRSLYHRKLRYLKREGHLDASSADTLDEVLNLNYNAVVADSLEARPDLSSTNRDACQIAREVFQSRSNVDLIGEEKQTLTLSAVTWDSAYRLVKSLEPIKNPIERIAELKKSNLIELPAEDIAQKEPRHLLARIYPVVLPQLAAEVIKMAVCYVIVPHDPEFKERMEAAHRMSPFLDSVTQSYTEALIEKATEGLFERYHAKRVSSISDGLIAQITSYERKRRNEEVH